MEVEYVKGEPPVDTQKAIVLRLTQTGSFANGLSADMQVHFARLPYGCNPKDIVNSDKHLEVSGAFSTELEGVELVVVYISLEGLYIRTWGSHTPCLSPEVVMGIKQTVGSYLQELANGWLPTALKLA